MSLEHQEMCDIEKKIQRLNIHDLETYEMYKSTKAAEGLTAEEVRMLSPDSPGFSSRDFWKWASSGPFSNDTVTFGQPASATIDECNEKNTRLAWEDGILNYFMRWTTVDGPVSVLEIGPGLGALKEVFERRPRTRYVGVDVYPRIEDVLPIVDGDTQIPESVFEDGPYQIIVASNVFQHLTPRQRRNYYAQVRHLLDPDVGVFSVSQFAIVPGAPPFGLGFWCGETRYACHYGQYTEIQRLEDIRADLDTFGLRVRAEQVKSGKAVTHHCTRKGAM